METIAFIIFAICVAAWLAYEIYTAPLERDIFPREFEDDED